MLCYALCPTTQQLFHCPVPHLTYVLQPDLPAPASSLVSRFIIQFPLIYVPC